MKRIKVRKCYEFYKCLKLMIQVHLYVPFFTISFIKGASLK